jgi:hypothetical protein
LHFVPHGGEDSYLAPLIYLRYVIESLLHEFFDFINFADYVDFEEATRYRCAPAAP